ncbi:hypothetical protein BDF20DRAFT_888520 [Mycotypha africana]|uniref:uncharacterized protein n=1 Tax=Mycotypha africana TaxID=64632 RepID=UPI002301D2A8|nr:uncharacterized protein BDF20DRAFT_888520 [Mycotypha africana]KAI8969941.1 hypothetical protein BDF20DRAFT_888520 [Mycotypha africana]
MLKTLRYHQPCHYVHRYYKCFKILYCGFDEAFSQIQQFLNCIINLNGFSLLISSFDVFYHNHRFYDDCAHSMSRIDRVATAKVSRKTYTEKHFMQISIFAGQYELLVVAGYIHRYGSITPFLGSSMDKFKLRTLSHVSKYLLLHQSSFVPSVF